MVVRFDIQNWLGREDSNLRMPDPKTGALPLGYAPMRISFYDAETTLRFYRKRFAILVSRNSCYDKLSPGRFIIEGFYRSLPCLFFVK